MAANVEVKAAKAVEANGAVKAAKAAAVNVAVKAVLAKVAVRPVARAVEARTNSNASERRNP